ncbi:MAG: site-specific integrase [Solirubrobacteraceae bacterium]|nr:site-specific integrase [Solirubrobacteraceae bacterium]
MPKSRREQVEPGIYVRRNAKGEKVYEVTFRDADGRQRWRTVKDKGVRPARAALATYKAESARGVRTADNPRLTFDQAADSWERDRVSQLRDSTQDVYKAHLKRLRQRFGPRRMTDITADDVARFIRDERADNRKGWTIKGSLTVFNGVHRHASRHMGLATQNPTRLLDSVERPGTSDEKPKRILSSDELARLLAHAGNHRLLFELAAQTGGRMSEVLGLTWENIDLEDSTVTFSHQVDRNGQRAPLKTKRSRRCLEVPDDLIRKLRDHKLASLHSGRHDFVFCARSGRALMQTNVGTRAFGNAATKAGLDAVVRDGVVIEPAPSFHSLRHSHASALIAAGWDLEEVSARLGHSDVGVTQRAYVHAYDASRRSDDRRARLAALYDSADEREVGNTVTSIK